MPARFFFSFWTGATLLLVPLREEGLWSLGILMGEDGIPGVNFAEDRSNSS